MASKSDDDKGTVKLTPTKVAAKPKLAKVTTAPVAKVVTVPKIVNIAPGIIYDDDDGPEVKQKLKKGDFVARIAERSEMKKSDLKTAIDATLAALAEALLAGEDVDLPPLGKFRVVKAKDAGDGASVITLKLRTMKDGKG